MAITIKQPERDSEGKTALDRKIEERKKKKSSSSTPAAPNNIPQNIPGPGRADQPTPQPTNQYSAPSGSSPSPNYSQQDPSQAAAIGQAQSIIGSAPGYTEATMLQKIGALPILQPARQIGQGIMSGDTSTGFSALGTVAGHAFNVYGATKIASAIANIGKVTAVEAASRIGTTGLYDYSITEGFSTAGTYATNAATKATTATWLGKIAKAATNPTAVVGTLLAVIGTYPFAGFIKEEALQTLGFATNTAIKNGDVAGAEEAIQLQKEVLNPTTWEQIKANIPFENVLKQLKDFYTAAQLKTGIDERLIADMKTQQETGETDEQKWARVNQEQADQERALIDYYNQERMKLLEWERQAKEQQRDEDAKFWAEQAEKQRQLEEADRKAIAEFWEAYRKRAQKIADDSRPSKLNFGII